MKNTLCDVKQLNSSGAQITDTLIKKEAKFMSLPFMIKAIVLCDDEQVTKGIDNLLSLVKNLELNFEKQLTFITQEYAIAIVVYTENENKTVTEIEKITNAGASVILIGDDLPQSLLRKSLQLSIKDFIPLATAESELLPVLESITRQLSSQASVAPVISVINGKGGSGASFITNSLGQVISNHCDQEIALFDADLQHGTLADSLNFKPDYYLDDALADVSELDSLAIKSMMVNRKNLSLLPVQSYSQLNCLSHIDQTKVNQLIGKLRLCYQLIITDLSRGLDELSIPIIESSEHIVVVVQQNIVSIREAKALIEQLNRTMGFKSENIHLIVNRYSEKFSTITLDDIKKTIGINSIFKISNDYQLANACTDLGKSLGEISGSKNIEHELINIIESIIPLDIEFSKNSKSLWSKITGK